MSADVTLHDLDLEGAPESQLRGAHAVAAPLSWSHVPGDEPAPFEEWMVEERRRQEAVDTRHVVAMADDLVVGHGFVELDRERNTHLAWVQLGVDATRRRQGIGRRLLARLVDIASADGRTSLGVGADEGSPGAEFAAAVGLSHRQVVHLNRLRTRELDRELLHDWVARAAERAGDYTLWSWDGPTPEEHVDAFAACTEVMNTAPLGDLEIEEERMTPERLRRREAANVVAGRTWWTIAAAEESSGVFVGFTQLSFSRWRPAHAKQSDTGVDPAHRDRGIGRWLKATMLLRLLAEKPEVETIDTGNAGSNAPMLSINHALDFRLARVSGNWQGDLDVVRKHLSEHS